MKARRHPRSNDTSRQHPSAARLAPPEHNLSEGTPPHPAQLISSLHQSEDSLSVPAPCDK